MRYIDPHLIEQRLPDDWSQRAAQARNDVTSAPPQARSQEVNRRSQIWQELKDTLRQISHNKCWYCESKEIRSDNAVDHFRPKNAVTECHGHEGYWWLAFRWENYRFCCTFCNCRRINQMTNEGGGKATHFPLRDETRRAHTPNANLDDEEPMLLDPCVSADPGLLWFEETGQAVPNPACGDGSDSYPRQRAIRSIEIYNLRQRDLVERRKELSLRIRRRVEDADRYFRRYQQGDTAARGAFEDAVRDLHGYLAGNAEYSSAARAMLKGLRGTHPVVEVILQAA